MNMNMEGNSMNMKMDSGGMDMKMHMDSKKMDGRSKLQPSQPKTESKMKMSESSLDMVMPGMEIERKSTGPSWDDLAKLPILDSKLALTGTPYTLAQLQGLASKNNPTLIQAHAQVEGERGKALQAGLYRNPDLAYSGQLMGVRNASLGEYQGGMLQQEVVLGGKLKFSRKKYQARQSAAEEQERAQNQRVINDVAVEFYKTLACMYKVQVHQEFVNSAQDSWLTNREMLNVGEAGQAQAERADAELEKSKLGLKAAENDLQFHWQQLTCLVGMDMPLSPLEGDLEVDSPSKPWNNVLQDTLARSPELGEAKAKLQSDQITLQREHRQRVPNLLLCAGPGYDQIDKSAAALATVSLTNLPVFNRNQGTIIQAEADLSRQKGQVKLIELQLRSKLAEQYKDYSTAQQHVDGYKSVIVPAAVRRYRYLLESYQAARTDWPAVLEAQKDVLAAKLSYIEFLAALHRAEIELNGFVLSGGLVPPPGVTPPGHIDATPNPR